MKHIFRKVKKRLKGMTLIECIIALAVFGVAALIMVKICSVSMQFLKNSNHVNNKVAAEAPAAAVQNVTLIRTEIDPNTGDTMETAPEPDDVNITVTAGSRSYTVATKKYDTGCMAQRSNRDTGSGLDNVDLEFYVIETAPPGP